MRALKFAVGLMGVMIIAGTVALVVLLVQRMNSAARGVSAGVSTELALRQPPGSRIGQIAPLDGGRLAVWVERPDGARILLVDPQSGRVAGEIRLGE
ncbi:DUF6476 family protein [Pseudoroseomonas cervicalis]|uniref:DUF6476 family protein n=1 Tax=Teichococcus cervicalis TaxID=204525 RepID=UPI0022F16E6C|nr:DUF6476 family protein [Pseudoroseomonas cervicalis]WBV42115.1 DUF6476 family protein [Pseudoroseomonas cervicalis]